MSQIASFYLLSEHDLQELGKLTKRLPQKRFPKGAHLKAVPVSPEDRLATANQYQAFDSFLDKHSKEPYQYKWSGSVMVYLVQYLAEEQKINFEPFRWDTGDDSETWYLFDNSVKTKLFDKLDPNKYREADLKAWYEPHAFGFLSSIINLVPEQFLKRQGTDEFKNRIHNVSEFPESGKAMLDGIKIIHDYLALVDKNNVVLFAIG